MAKPRGIDYEAKCIENCLPKRSPRELWGRLSIPRNQDLRKEVATRPRYRPRPTRQPTSRIHSRNRIPTRDRMRTFSRQGRFGENCAHPNSHTDDLSCPHSRSRTQRIPAQLASTEDRVVLYYQKQ